MNRSGAEVESRNGSRRESCGERCDESRGERCDESRRESCGESCAKIVPVKPVVDAAQAEKILLKLYDDYREEVSAALAAVSHTVRHGRLMRIVDHHFTTKYSVHIGLSEALPAAKSVCYFHAANNHVVEIILRRFILSTSFTYHGFSAADGGRIFMDSERHLSYVGKLLRYCEGNTNKEWHFTSANPETESLLNYCSGDRSKAHHLSCVKRAARTAYMRALMCLAIIGYESQIYKNSLTAPAYSRFYKRLLITIRRSVSGAAQGATPFALAIEIRGT